MTLSQRVSKLFDCAATIVVAIVSFFGVHAAGAQGYAPPPLDYQLDANGVDWATGQFYFSRGPDVSIGPAGPQGLSYSIMSTLEFVANWSSNMYADESGWQVSLGHRSDHMDPVDGFSTQGTGAVLGQDLSTPPVRIYTTRSGTQYFWDASEVHVESIRYVSGERITFQRETHSVGGSIYSRVKYIKNNAGYALRLDYQRAELPPAGNVVEGVRWYTVAKVTAINTAVCGLDESCAQSSSWPSASYSFSGSLLLPYCPSGCYRTVTDANGGVWRYTFNSDNKLVGIATPGQSSDAITIAYNSGKVSSVTNATGTTSYSYGPVNVALTTTTATDAAGNQTIATYDTSTKKVVSIRDALTRTTSYIYDARKRLNRVTYPEGNYTRYTYDARDNVTETRQVSKSPSTEPDIFATASYDSQCFTLAKCNKPNYTVDGRGNRTDYSYDLNHGGLLTVTLPAPTAGAVRPQTRYVYNSLYAWFKNGSGAVVAAAQPIVKLTSIATCQSAASCAGTVDEVKTTIDYGAVAWPTICCRRVLRLRQVPASWPAPSPRAMTT